jgi:hypothetical protein
MKWNLSANIYIYVWPLAVPLQTGFTVAVIQRTYYFIVQDRIHVGFFHPK